MTGAETLNVRETCGTLSRLMRKTPRFTGAESATALLSNAAKSHALFGEPRVPASRVMEWVADWVRRGGPALGKPTHFESRDGKF